MIEQDPRLWLGNGLTAGLENAGYHVDHVEEPKDAKTPVVINAGVTGITTAPAGGLFSARCKVTLAASVTIAKGRREIFERSYDGEDDQLRGCAQTKPLTVAMEKALDNLLGKAVPEITAAIAPFTQP